MYGMVWYEIQFMLISSRHISNRSMLQHVSTLPNTIEGDFRVAFRLCFKASPSVKAFPVEISFIHM